MQAVDLSLLVVRVTISAVFVAHACSHIFGGGKIAGTTRWFESLGTRPTLNARTASLTQLGAGLLLILGLLTPLACTGVIGTRAAAWITNHLRNGFSFSVPARG
jgi:putative oxidoreductase